MNSNNQDISQNILKSNTSLVGIVCKDGVIIGADRRGTAGTIVLSKNHIKINKINDYLAAAYTGGVADLQLTNKVLAAELRLKELKTKSRPSVKEAAHLLAMMTYRNIRNPTMIPNIVGSLIAGVDEDGKASLFSIEPAGAVDEVEDYDANFSSGMPYILGFLERAYKKDLSVKEAIELAKECIKSSTQRDVGSGNGIDVFSITKDGIKHVVSEEIIAEYK
ncbi:MAG: proteasome subunit beta [Nanoarchaeota archaeon]